MNADTAYWLLGAVGVLALTAIVSVVVAHALRDNEARRAFGEQLNPRMLYWTQLDGTRVCKPVHLIPGPVIQRLIDEREGSYDG